MKIMYLIDFGFDTPNGSSCLVIKMIDTFLNLGHEVYLLESHSNGIFEDIPDILQGRKNFLFDVIQRPIVGRSNFVKRYLSGIKFEIDAKKRWKEKVEYADIVIHHSHYTSPFMAFFLKKYKQKVIFNIYDIFPGEAYTNGSIKSKFIYNILGYMQKIIYRNSAKIFTLTEDTKKTLRGLKIESTKIAVIPNWFDDSTARQINYEDSTFVREFGLSRTKKYIQYAGSVGIAYDFDLFLDVAKKFKSRNDVVFQIVGEGIFLEKTKKRAADEKINNVQFIPWQPSERIYEVYSACTIQIVPLRKDVIRNSFPSKILPLMVCGRIPVVSVEEDTYFYKMINEKKVGIATPLGDVDALARGIELFIDSESLRKEYENNARKFVYDNYTAKYNINKMLREFCDIINGNKDKNNH